MVEAAKPVREEASARGLRTKVMKFGGASLASGERVAQVAELVQSHLDEHPVLAISAMLGVTDAIDENLPKILASEAQVHIFVDALREKHLTAAKNCIRDPKILEATQWALRKSVERLERLLFGVAYVEEITDKARDFAMSFGERLSAILLAGAMRDRGIDAVALEAEKVGIVTDGAFGNATPLLGEIEQNVKKTLVPLLERRQVPVVTGFYGVDRQGNVTLFGRGGTDYTAAILAHALDASVLEIWKDVDGFMTTDPRVVPEAQVLPLLSYDEAAELATFGAKVLHPRTVEPVSLKRIPIRVKHTMKPNEAGTLIVPFDEADTSLMRSCAARSGLAIVKLIGPGMATTQGVALKVFAALDKRRVNVINMAASQASFALLVESKDVPNAVACLETIKGGIVQDIQVIDNMALICVVGKGLGETPGSAAQILGAISKASVNIEMISVGASAIAIDVVIKARDRDRTVKAVHDTFLTREAKERLRTITVPSGGG